MPIEFRDTNNVTIRPTDSANLVEVATRIKTLRDTAKNATREHTRAIEAINNDASLSDIGKQERISELENTRNAQRKTWIASEKEIIANKITELERRLDGFVGYSESNIMAFRDAQDRAEAITDKDRAATVMARALRTNDKTLAHALYRRAVENRWAEAGNAFAAENPSVANLVNEVHKLNELRDASFNRTVAYM